MDGWMDGWMIVETKHQLSQWLGQHIHTQPVSQPVTLASSHTDRQTQSCPRAASSHRAPSPLPPPPQPPPPTTTTTIDSFCLHILAL